ncbi:MAG: MarR family transcriptional regulator [Solirubrobacteraceae bacterium]
MNRDIREVIRDEPLVRSTLLAHLRSGGPQTIPQLASASGKPEDEVMVWMMGMRKYGYVAELEAVDADGYYQYAAVKGR